MPKTARLSALAVLLVTACTLGSTTGRAPASVDARAIRYSDNAGLEVTTLAANVEQPVPGPVTFTGRLIADHVVVEPKALNPGHAGGNQNTGHDPTEHGADVVTSASSTVASGSGADKWRYEGTLGARLEGELSGNPARIWAQARASTEPDYQSTSALLRGTIELFERNTTASAFGGFGKDFVQPYEPPPGEGGLWPATHDRFTGGLNVAQLLSPRWVLSAGAAATWQRGTLENPYRRALVRTSFFPEAVPDRRMRYTAFVGVALYVGYGLAIHARQGVYWDSWKVASIIPELGAGLEVSPRGLLAVHYRYYAQRAASFYAFRYDTILPVMSSDLRLGAITDHTLGGSFSYRLFGSPEEWTFGTRIGYDVSFLVYKDPGTLAVAHVPQLGIFGTY